MVLMSILSGCGGGRDEEFALPNGFSFVRSNSATAAIFVPDDMIAETGGYYGPGVTILTIHDNKVYGRIDPAPGASIPQRSQQGYFVLDTVARTFTSGLTKSQYTSLGGQLRNQ